MGEVIRGILIPFIGTTLGASCVLFMKKMMNKMVQRALTGFAAGIMVSASVWSLLIPSMDYAAEMGKFAFVPAVVGFWIGILFLLAMDHIIPHLHMDTDKAEGPKSKLKKDNNDCICCYTSQYSRGNGCGRCICRLSCRKYANIGYGCVGFGNRYCNSEFPGGSNYINAA